jgi:GTP cyclohydrolase I
VAHSNLDKKVDCALLGLFNELPVKPSATMLETPRRWLKAMRQLTSGYSVDIPALFKTFDGVGYDGLIAVGPIKFFSVCEHHLLPFYGDVWVGYLPNARTGRIVGLSKLARLVGAHAKRLQVQERMTHDIAADVRKHLNAAGVGVRIESTHTCMAARGAEKEGVMRTQTLLGKFRVAAVRAEFVNLCRRSV